MAEDKFSETPDLSVSEETDFTHEFIQNQIQKQNSDFTSIIQDVESSFDRKLLDMKNHNAKLENKVDRILDLLSPGVAARSATQGNDINLSEVQTSTSEVQTSAKGLCDDSSETTSEVETSKEAGGVETLNRKRKSHSSTTEFGDFDKPLQEPPKKKVPTKIVNRHPDLDEVSLAQSDLVQEERPELSEEAQVLMEPADVLEVLVDESEISALLGTYEDDAPEAQEAHAHIANFVNSRFRNKVKPMHAKELEQEFPVPENCANMRVPAVNPAIWKVMPERLRVCDVTLKNIQRDISIAGAANASVIADLQSLKNQAEGDEAKSEISKIVTKAGNALALMGSAFQGLNNKRKKDIKPCLNPSLSDLCAESNPVSPDWLFGDYLSNSVRDIQDERRVVNQVARASFSQRGPQRGQRGKYRGKQTGHHKQFTFNFSQPRGGSSAQNDRRPKRSRGRGQYRGRGGSY